MRVSSRHMFCLVALAMCAGAPVVVSGQESSPLTLDDAITSALVHNPDILRARAAIESARAESVAASVRPYNPELDAEMSRGGDTVLKGSDWSASIGITQTIERSGKRPARVAVARTALAVAGAQVRVEERRVTLALRRAFARAAILADQRATLAFAAAIDREIADATARRVRDGVVTPFASRLTALEASRSEGEVRRIRAEEHATEAGVQTLLGSPAAGGVRLVAATELKVAPLPPDSTLLDYALTHRADLEPLRRQVEAAEAQRVLAQREGQPDPTLGLALETHQQTLAGTVRGDPAVVRGFSSLSDHSYELRARVSVPLPFHNRNQAGRARAEAAVMVARAELARGEAAILAEVRAATVRNADAEGLATFYRDAARQARADLDLLHEAYRGGRISLEDYLTDKGRLLDAFTRSLSAAEQALTARADLETVVGAPLEDIVQGGSSR